VEIADNLIAYPILSVDTSMAIHGRTDQANRNAINDLVGLGLPEPDDDRGCVQLFWNPQVFQIIDR
jgi:hypothetical protein